MKQNLLKIATLTLFLSLISGFVLYRSGYLGRVGIFFSGSPNGSNLNNQSHSLDTTKSRQMLSSTKSLILSDLKINKADSFHFDLDSNLKSKFLMMFSSKSGIIVNPEDMTFFKSDSTLSDSSNMEK